MVENDQNARKWVKSPWSEIRGPSSRSQVLRLRFDDGSVLVYRGLLALGGMYISDPNQ
jgi:hypothetical protein